jgi:hypothetical protein
MRHIRLSPKIGFKMLNKEEKKVAPPLRASLMEASPQESSS